jgi:hypothetical protein
MQTAVAHSSPITGAVVARAKPSRKRRRTTAPAVAAPTEGVAQPDNRPPIPTLARPSPQVLNYRAVMEIALDGQRPALGDHDVRWVRNKIAKLKFTLQEIKLVTDALNHTVDDGPEYQFPSSRLSSEAARARIVQPWGVSRYVYWEAAYLALRACASEVARRSVRDLPSAYLQHSIVTWRPGLLPKEERAAAISRLSATLRKVLDDKLPWQPAEPA